MRRQWIAGEVKQKRNMTEELREEEKKKRGHIEGQNNLEPITQSTQWDPSTHHTPPLTVLMMSYYSEALHSPT